MPDAQQLRYEIVTDEKGAITGIKKFDKAVDKTSDKITKQQKKMKEHKGFLSKLKGGYVAFAGVLTGVVAIAFGKLIKKASEFQEVNAKFKTVFRGVEKEAKLMSDELVAAYGLSTIEARKFLSSVQDLFVPLGLDRKAAAALSGDVVKLARDIASFNNLPTGEVLRDIQSALVGNFETVRKYGVVLSDTALKQKILDDTGREVKGTIDAQERALVALKMITEGSSDAIGDFQRTSGGFANQVRILRAKLEDWAVTLGGKLMPLFAPAIKLLSRLLTSTADYRLEMVEQSAAQLKTSDTTDKLITRYAELEGKTKRTAAENEEFRRISVKLKDILPEVVTGVDDLSGAYRINTKEARKLNEQQRALARQMILIKAKEAEKDIVRLEAANRGLKAAIKLTSQEYINLNDKINKGIKATNNYVVIQTAWGKSLTTAGLGLEALSKSQTKYTENLKENEEAQAKNISVIERAIELGIPVTKSAAAIVKAHQEIREVYAQESVAFDNLREKEKEQTQKAEEETEKKKADIADYYAYVENQRALDEIKENERFQRAREGLDLMLEERKIKRSEHGVMMEGLREQHETNLDKIIEKHGKKKVKIEEGFAKSIQEIWNKQITSTADSYIDELFEMGLEGEKFKKNFRDIAIDVAKGITKMIGKMILMKGIMTLLGIPTIPGFFKKGGFVFAQGGKVTGPPHSQGGKNINVEGGEFVVKKESVTSNTLPMLTAINKSMGNLASLSIPANRPSPGMQAGGVVNRDERRSVMINKVEITSPEPGPLFEQFIEFGEDMGVDIIRRG